MEKLITSTKGRRNRALLSIMYWSGRRVGEVVSLKREDVSPLQNNNIYLVSFKITKTKEDKTIITPIPLDNIFGRYFHDHLFWFDQKNHTGQLFPITTGRVGQIVKNIDPTISPHWFRHCRATHLGSVMNIWELCSYFGWKKIETALIYTHMSPSIVLNKMVKVEIIDRRKNPD